jgi:alanine dehydrogenase
MRVALFLRESEVAALLDMGEVMGALEASMAELGASVAQNQPRRRVLVSGRVLSVMFASFPGAGLFGLKTCSVYEGRARCMVVAYGMDGMPVALIEAAQMGTFRTGSATGVAAKHLSGTSKVRVGLIGAGRQAFTQLQALKEVLTISSVAVFSRSPASRERAAAIYRQRLHVNATAVSSAEEAVREADVVVAITTSRAPVLEADWVKPTALVIAAGSNYPEKAELPPELIANASNVVVDQLETARLECGDLIQAHAAGAFEWSRAIELGAIVAGKSDVERSAGGPTIFESHGLALWDIAAASVILPKARERGLGTQVRLFYCLNCGLVQARICQACADLMVQGYPDTNIDCTHRHPVLCEPCAVERAAEAAQTGVAPDLSSYV